MRNGVTLAIVFTLLILPACDTGKAEERELLRRQVELMERAERAEAEREAERQRLEAERRRQEEERRRAEAERARLDSLAGRYAAQAGRQVMNAIGGGQDLVTRYGDWRFDPAQRLFTIPMTVSFNGSINRSNQYRVSGVLTVAENGSNPRFAREQANQNYRDMEGLVFTIGLTAAGLYILNDLAQESRQ
jgi:multidrug efflux pump subunit AcrA (membrane-fusion protein)